MGGLFTPVNVNTISGNPIDVGNPSWTTTSYAVEYTGVFVPNATGTWAFSMYADDFGLLWLGSSAESGFSINNAVVKCRTSDPGQVGTISLTAGQAYPLRVQYSNGPGARIFNLQVTPPGGSETNNFSPYVYYSTCNVVWSGPSTIVNFGYGTVTDYDGNPVTVTRFLKFSNIRGVTRVKIFTKLIEATSTVGYTFDNMPAQSMQLSYDSNTYGDENGPAGLGVLLGGINGVIAHTREANFSPGSCVIAARLEVYTTSSPGPTPAFVTSTSSSPVNDYINTAGSNNGGDTGGGYSLWGK